MANEGDKDRSNSEAFTAAQAHEMGRKAEDMKLNRHIA